VEGGDFTLNGFKRKAIENKTAYCKEKYIVSKLPELEGEPFVKESVLEKHYWRELGNIFGERHCLMGEYLDERMLPELVLSCPFFFSTRQY
jgi:hypothetical protein